VPVAGPGHLVRPVPGIPDEHEGAAGEPPQQQAEQPAHELCRGPVPDALGRADLGGAVQVHQDGQRPPPGGERELDQDGEDDPLVPVPPGRVRVARPDRVAVPGLPVHRPAGVPVDRVTADQVDRPVRDEVVEQEPREGAPQLQPGPRGAGEDPAVVGRVAGGEVPEGPQQVGDGPPTGGEHRPDQEG
jgi:hypothetical protein